MEEQMNNLINKIKLGEKEVKFETNVICEGSGEEEKITISFQPSKEYDPNYESDSIKFIKNSKVISGDDLTFENGYIFHKNDGGFSIDTPFHRDFEYKMLYIRKRDKNTLTSLKFGTAILFDRDIENFENNNSIDNKSKFDRKKIDEEKIDGEKFDGEKSGEKKSDEEESDEEDNVGIYYDAYLENRFKLKNENNIVFESSEIKVLFESPNYRENVIFIIKADDVIKGFTKKELLIKLFKRYHLLYYLNKNYDSNKGIFDLNKGNDMFGPVIDDYEFLENGIHSLIYVKPDCWKVICLNYI